MIYKLGSNKIYYKEIDKEEHMRNNLPYECTNFTSNVYLSLTLLLIFFLGSENEIKVPFSSFKYLQNENVLSRLWLNN